MLVCDVLCFDFFFLLGFRSKRVIELGAGYGLAGLVIAAVTEASEVVITDGNPQVVDCILILSLLLVIRMGIVVILTHIHTTRTQNEYFNENEQPREMVKYLSPVGQ